MAWCFTGFISILLMTFAGPGLVSYAQAAGQPVPTSVPITTIAEGQYSGIHEPLEIIIRTQEDWALFWQWHTSGQAPAPPLPHVDFDREMVAGVFLGEKSTGGYQVEITGAHPGESGLHVSYRVKSPPQGAIVAQVITQPHHLIRLPWYNDPVTFKRGP